MEVEVPAKLYFRIGEVAELTSLKPSVLRFWETEFHELKPVKSRSGQRLYTKKNVETILQIKKLLYQDRMTIEGAKKTISKQNSNTVEKPGIDAKTRILREIKQDLILFRDSL